nr:hypothetical protein [Bacteroidales bacterium]
RQEGIEYEEFKNENIDKLKYRKFLNRVRSKLSTISTRMKLVKASNKSSDVKRQELDLLLTRRNKLAEMAVHKYLGES